MKFNFRKNSKEYASIGHPARGPKQHQYAGQIIAANLKAILDPNYYRALHEANLFDTKLDSKAPDVTVYNLQGEPLASFQVSLKSTLYKEKKILDYIFNTGVSEVFVFTYKPTGIFEFEITDIKKYIPNGKKYKPAINKHFSDTLSIVIDNTLADDGINPPQPPTPLPDLI